MIELSRLTNLSVMFSSGIDPCRLFQRLFLPALISLELSVKTETLRTNHAEWQHVQTMLAHSCPPLRTLILWYVPMTEGTLVGCLSNVPTLAELELQGMACGDTILGALTMGEDAANGSKGLCPWLETIEFGYDGGLFEFSERAMTRMVVSRWENANNTGFTGGRAVISIRGDCSYAFDGIRSNPDIAGCIQELG
ncbi:hypothetical protein BD410DRAFT_844256 [Rickenella mellea]|uniref:F-box domain-containing protein n=1 Tax=Rickenella mellea TaxID=50990 RepID=A0A4Y7PP16_9AGAM|nr:hypothetical protein BD410DRAFT_844256 [Rickenella mellea]